MTYFCLIQNSLNADDLQNVARHTEKLFATFSNNKIQAQLKVTSTNIFMAHYSQDLLVPVITEKLEQMSDAVPQLDPPINEDKAHLDSNAKHFSDDSGNTSHSGFTDLAQTMELSPPENLYSPGARISTP